MEKSLEVAAIVLACDLTPEGLLGKHTLARLERGLSWYRQNKGVVVVAAGRSPYHPKLRATMAELMGGWLARHQCYNIDVRRATTFDTRGELTSFRQLTVDHYVIISAWWHLPRVKLIVWQVFGFGAPVELVAAWSDIPTIKQLVLEVPNYVHVLLPPVWRVRARTLWERLFGRSAW